MNKKNKSNWNNEVISCDVFAGNLMAECDSCGFEFNIAVVQTDKNLICRCASCGQRIKLSVFVD